MSAYRRRVLDRELDTLRQSLRAVLIEGPNGVGKTKGGREEIDLIVVRGDQRVLAVEVKLSAAVDDEDVRHLHWLRNRIGNDLLDAIVITTGPQAYRRKDGIGVVPAALLGP